jgi:CRISPR/Cas system Type II protein with McrA/HNH and RuvC-like nuclease domain
MFKLQGKELKNYVIELYKTKKGFSILRWKYYNLQKNTEMYLQQKIDFNRQAGETALDAYDDLICELSGGEG